MIPPRVNKLRSLREDMGGVVDVEGSHCARVHLCDRRIDYWSPRGRVDWVASGEIRRDEPEGDVPGVRGDAPLNYIRTCGVVSVTESLIGGNVCSSNACNAEGREV